MQAGKISSTWVPDRRALHSAQRGASRGSHERGKSVKERAIHDAESLAMVTQCMLLCHPDSDKVCVPDNRCASWHLVPRQINLSKLRISSKASQPDAAEQSSNTTEAVIGS
jgi:hypothetical protein